MSQNALSLTLWLPFLLALLAGFCLAQPSVEDPHLKAGYELYDRGEFAAARKKFEEAANARNVEAQYMLGLLHHRGRGTTVNGKEALRWYQLAARENHPAALTNLGIILRDGLGEGEGRVEPNVQAAMDALRRASYLENVPGQLAYAALLINRQQTPEERIEGIAFMRIAAAAGDEIARDNLKTLVVNPDEDRAAIDMRSQIEANIAKIRLIREKEAQQRVKSNKAPLRLTRIAVKDPMVNDCVALTLLVPSHWRFEGRMNWLLDDSVLVNPEWRLQDPESGLTMRSLPFRQFTWSPGHVLPVGSKHLGMIVLPPIQDPAEFVARFYATDTLPHLQGLSPERVQELPALAAQTLVEWGGNAQCKAYRMRYRYEQGGKAFEDDVIFALLFAPGDPTIWLVSHCHAMTAEAGQLDGHQRLLSAIYASGEYSSEWRASWQVCSQIFARRARQEILGARQLAAALEEHRADLERIQKDLEQNRDASMTARQRALSEALGGIETWTDPHTDKRMELPQGYAESWVNEGGEILLIEKPGIDPNASGTRIEGQWKRASKVDPMRDR